MLYPYHITLLILCPLIFLAAFIDAVAGGGGLISLPAYIFVGIPIHKAYGTNKFPASLGITVAAANYLRGRCVDYPAAISGAAGALLGSWIGTRLAISLSPGVLQICLMVILPAVGIFIFFKHGAKGPSRQSSPRSKRFTLIVSPLIGLVCGCYDGFFGPGAGMFMTLALSGLVRLDLIKSVGTSKVINFVSTTASMFTWLASGNIFFPVAVPCTGCAVLGGFLGSRMAMRIGKKFIRPILAFVLVLLFVKILLDVAGNYGK